MADPKGPIVLCSAPFVNLERRRSLADLYEFLNEICCRSISLSACLCTNVVQQRQGKSQHNELHRIMDYRSSHHRTRQVWNVGEFLYERHFEYDRVFDQQFGATIRVDRRDNLSLPDDVSG